MENKVSIIVPVYNLQEYIDKTIQSILKQTYKNIEIILVDDGSTDNSPEILDNYSLKDKRIKVIHKQNEGVSKARVEGIKESTGEYIGFVDGDDIIESEMFEILLTNAISNDADISHCGYVMDFPDGHSDFYYNTKNKVIQNNFDGLYDLVEGKFIEPGLWNKIYKRDTVLKAIDSHEMDFNIKVYEDLLLNYLFFRESKKSVYEDVCLYHYTLRKSSAATSERIEKYRDPIIVLQKIIDLSHNEDIKKVANERYIHVLITNSLQDAYPDVKNKALELLKMEIKNKNNYTNKTKCMLIGIMYFYPLFKSLKKIHNYLSGNDKKYKI